MKGKGGKRREKKERRMERWGDMHQNRKEWSRVEEELSEGSDLVLRFRFR